MYNQHWRCGTPPPLYILVLQKTFFLPEIFFSKIQNLGLKISVLDDVKGKIKILINDNLICRQFADVCRKIANSRSLYFFRSRRR